MKLLSQKDEDTSQLKLQVQQLDGRMEQLEEKIDENDNIERKTSVILSGGNMPTAVDGEECVLV